MRTTLQTLVRILGVTFAGTIISGCELQRAQEASDAKKLLIGMSREHVLACMGSPVNAAKAGGTEVWTYASGNNHTDSFGSVSAWGGWGFASGFGSSTSTSRSCKIDIVMNEGRVSRVNYTGPTGGLLTKGEQCAFALEACLEDPGSPPMAPVNLTPTQSASPAPIKAAEDSYAGSTSATTTETAPAKLCTEQDRRVARYAKANGFTYNGACR